MSDVKKLYDLLQLRMVYRIETNAKLQDDLPVTFYGEYRGGTVEDGVAYATFRTYANSDIILEYSINVQRIKNAIPAF